MSKILIIGNGFDLNLGLRTTYKDFLLSEEFKALLENDTNWLVAYLNSLSQSTLYNKFWVDIEHELKSYSKLLDTEYHNIPYNTFLSDMIEDLMRRPPYVRITSPFDRRNKVIKNRKIATKQEFQELKTSLHSYLNKQVETFEKSNAASLNSSAFWLLHTGNLIETKKDYTNAPFDEIYSFNYTNALSLVNLDNSSYATKTEFFYVHGSLAENNIVFGVEDGSVSEEFIFLNKSSHAAFGSSPDISDAIINASEVHFFGCSLGDTDDAHFKHPFKVISQRRNKTRKTQLFFYTFGKSGYQNIMKRILALTENRLSEFKITNDVFFYDLENSQLIDQQWINNL